MRRSEVVTYGARPEPTVFFEDDFISYSTSATVDLATWFGTVGGTSDTITCIDSGTGGKLQLLTGTVDNDECSAQVNGESFKLAAGKRLKFQTLNLNANGNTLISQVGVFLGLSISSTTTMGADAIKIAGMTDFVGFLWDGTDLFAVAGKNATATAWTASTSISKIDTGLALVDATDIDLSFEYDGADTIRWYADGVLVATLTDAGTKTLIPDDEDLTPTIGAISLTGAAQTVTLDYISVEMDR